MASQLAPARVEMEFSIIGVGASPAGPVLARPLFQQFNKIHYKNCTRLLQPDHFKSPSYTPVYCQLEMNTNASE